MTEYNKPINSKFFKKFPNVYFYWCAIDSAKETLNDVSKHLFLIPTHIRSTQFLLKDLKQQRNEGFYKDHENCEEIKEIQDALEDVIKRLTKLALELKINVKDTIVVDDIEWEFKDCPIDQIQSGLYDLRTAYEHRT